MPDDTERLRAWQALGWAQHNLGIVWERTEDEAFTAAERQAFAHGAAGEPPPCGCVAVLREREQAARRVVQQYPGSWAGRDYYVAANALRDARAALGDTEAVE